MAENEEKMASTVAADQTMSTNAMGYGAGLMPNDPEAKQRLAEMQKVRTGDIFQTGIQGAALGMQAAQGQTNPLAAVVQAFAAGMQAPAQMYQQKQKQIESAVGAMPFGVVVPEAQDPNSPYNVLAGIPYELASKAIAGIAQEAMKVSQQAKAQESEAQREYIQPGEDAERAAKLLEEADGKRRTPSSLVGFRRQDLEKLIKPIDATPKPTIGSVATDRAFAREYSDYIGAGGYADVQNQIKSLEDARSQLASGGQYTGFFTNLFSGNIVNPKAKALQQQIESSIQRSLRQTLGAQFTEKEGALFMQRGFDPRLSEKQNIKKLDSMIDQLKIMDIAKREAMNYFEENGTLEGYRGKFYTMKDGKIVVNDAVTNEPVEGLSAEEAKELEELKKKAGK